MNTQDKNGPGYERSDAKLKPLVLFSIALAVLVVLALWVVAAMESAFDRERVVTDSRHPLRELREAPPGPALQANPQIEISDHRRRVGALLNHYAWIDSQNEIVRIPIDRAMALVSERGLPSRGGEGDPEEGER